MVVDLLAPLGPRKPVTVPGRTVKLLSDLRRTGYAVGHTWATNQAAWATALSAAASRPGWSTKSCQSRGQLV